MSIVMENINVYDENVFFVKVVEKYPTIYNSHLPEYSIREEVEKAWRAVAEEVQADVSVCKLKWKCCRSSYARYIRKVATRGTKPKVYYLAKHMKYLYPFTKLRKYGLGATANCCASVNGDEKDDESGDADVTFEECSDAEREDNMKEEILNVEEINNARKAPNVVILGTFSEYLKGQSNFEDAANKKDHSYGTSGEDGDSSVGDTDFSQNIPKLLAQSSKYAKKRAVLPNADNSSHAELKRKCPESDLENPDLLFLKSLLPDIIKLTPSQKSRFKLFVMDKLNSMLYGDS